ncbi:uncharacterized protein BO95DRAFT_446571 [Aspergillus brunneoviolaceus CBS 621.78]|uniref:Uncharacterized protein n=1 Tax=Aspergillus brunneoviolaceus CBS 621.78 TaxID=1450534 RepID=A0ACD1FY01_9EURO|nr:hypothetical protein BO95DRAFT_446571 [Aspergillus brunneoviolaceus CBS 621.78]RAH41835.1 hypothetical protein BO95DRAFT_446571 [Aspergillus brunneoviolaceus CBS 621.78]
MLIHGETSPAEGQLERLKGSKVRFPRTAAPFGQPRLRPSPTKRTSSKLRISYRVSTFDELAEGAICEMCRL